ncbi:MAG: peptidase [Flavobacteriales bacterium CG_4_9_14_3_um_filter_40_17]|nr:MAG: peptidase [Flavobacteriales bacterium CG_4_9_14_3_um_filter_40_17]
MTKKLIGRVETADFPDLGLINVPVKIDTGAYTSSIHYQEMTEKNSKLYCVFNNFPKNSFKRQVVVFEDFRTTLVKSSNGIPQKRYKIKTTVIFFQKKYKISLTLAKRKSMRYPALLGRKFLSGKFVIDSSRVNLSKNK